MCHGLRHHLLVSWGVVEELVAAPRSSVTVLACEAEAHDPDRWDRGFHHSGWPVSRPSSWIPSHSGWNRTCVLSGSISPVVMVPVVTALGGVVLSELHGAGMASDRTEVTVVPLVLAGSEWHAYPCQNGRA